MNNLKNMKNIHGGVLLLVILLKEILLHGSFEGFSNSTNDTKSQKACQMAFEE